MDTIPFHCGILGNENADALAKKGSTATHRPVTKSTNYSVKRFIKSTYLDFNKQNLITQSQGKKWNSLHQNPQLIPDLPRKSFVAAFRLATGHDCLAKHLHRIGIYQSPNCPLCNSNQEMDSEHLKICASVAVRSPESEQSIVEEKVLVPQIVLSRCDINSATFQPDSVQEEQCVRRSPRKVGVKVINASASKSVSKIKDNIVSIKETSPGMEDDVSDVRIKKSASRKQDDPYSVTKISPRKKMSTNNSVSDTQEIIVSAEINSNGIFANKKCKTKADIEVHRKTRTLRGLSLQKNESSSTRCEEGRLDSGSCADIVTTSDKKDECSHSNSINPSQNNEPHNECSTIDQFLLMAREKLASKPHLIAHMINYINSFPSNVNVLEESNCVGKHSSSDSKLNNVWDVAVSNAEECERECSFDGNVTSLTHSSPYLNENERNYAAVRKMSPDFTDSTNVVEPKYLSEEDNKSSVVCNENSSQILSNVPEHNLCYSAASSSDESCAVATDSGSKSTHDILEENCSVEKSVIGLEFDSKSICNNYTIGAESKSVSNVISENISSTNSALSETSSTESENGVLIGKSQYEVGTENIQHKITKCSLTSDDIVTMQDITKLDSNSNHKSECYNEIGSSNKNLLKTTSLRDQKTVDQRQVNERTDSYKQKCDMSCSSDNVKINKSNIDSVNMSGVDNNNAFYCEGTKRVHRIERNNEPESIKNLSKHVSQDAADTGFDIKCGSGNNVQVLKEAESCRSVNSGDISSVGNLSVIGDEHTDTRIEYKQIEDNNIVITERLVNSTTRQSQTLVTNSKSTSSSELKDSSCDSVFKNTLSPPSASYKKMYLRDTAESHSVKQYHEVTSHETVENGEQCHTLDCSSTSGTLNTNISSELNVEQISQNKSSLTINGMSSKQPTKRIVLSRSFQDSRPVQARRRFFRKVLKSVNCESVQNTSETAPSVSVPSDIEACKTYPEVSQNIGNRSVLSKKLPLSRTKSFESISSSENHQVSSYSVKSSDSQLETCTAPLKSHKEIKLSDNNASHSPSNKMRKTSSENFQCTSVVNTKPFLNSVFVPRSTKRTSDVNFKIPRRPSSVIDSSKTSITVQNSLTNMSHISKPKCSPCSSLTASRINSVEHSNESYHDKMFHSKNPGVNIATKYKAISSTRSRSVDGRDSASPEAASMYSAAKSSELPHSPSSEAYLQYRNRRLTETINDVPNPEGPDDDSLSLYASSSLFKISCEVRSVIKFFNAQNMTLIEIHRQLCQVYGPDIMRKQMLSCWCRQFSGGRQNVHDVECSGWPSLAMDNPVEQNPAAIFRRFPTLYCTKLSQSTCCLRKCVPGGVETADTQTQNMGSVLTFLEWYHNGGNEFLDQIITGDETELPNWQDYSNSAPCRLSTVLPVPKQAISNTKEDRNSKVVATARISREENGLQKRVNEMETLGNDLEDHDIDMDSILKLHFVENNHDAEKEGFIIEGGKNSISEDVNWNVCVQDIEELNLEYTQDSNTKRDRPENKPKMHFASNNKVPDIQTLNNDKVETILFSKQNNFQHFLESSFDVLIRTAYEQAGHELWGFLMQFATITGMAKSQALKQIFNYIKINESSWSPNLNNLLLLVLQEDLLRDGLVGFKMLSKLGCDSFPENLLKKLIEHIVSNSYDKDFMRELYDDVIVHIPLSILKVIGFVPLKEFSLKLEHCGLKTEAETFNRKLSSPTIADNQTFEFATNQSKLIQVCKGSPCESIAKPNWKQTDMQNNCPMQNCPTNGENENKCISSDVSLQVNNQKREIEHSRFQISEGISCDSIHEPRRKIQLKISPQNSTDSTASGVSFPNKQRTAKEHSRFQISEGISCDSIHKPRRKIQLNRSPQNSTDSTSSEVSFPNKQRTAKERITVVSDLQQSSNINTGNSDTRDLRQLLNEKRKRNFEHSMNNRVVDNLASFNISSQLSDENKISIKNDLRSVLNIRSSHSSFVQKQSVSNPGILTAFLDMKNKNPVNCKFEVKRFKRNKFEKQHNLKTSAVQINHLQNQQELFQVPSPFMKPSERMFVSPGMKFMQNRELNTDCNAVILQTALGTRDWITIVHIFENCVDRTESIGIAHQVYEVLRQDMEISTTNFLFLMQEAEKRNMRASPFLEIIMSVIGINVMLDLTVHEKWNEAYDIYIRMKKMEIDFHQLQEEILKAMQGISIDTSAGPDKILMRTIKCEKVAVILALIGTKMLSHNWVPNFFRKARTVLIYKGGEKKDPNNYRPITICSVIRRVLERCLCSRMQQYVEFNENQRGFVSTAGAQINASILNSVLRKAKIEKEDVTILFLDVHKAYDTVGHQHLESVIHNSALPQKLQDLIINLQCGNETQIEVGIHKTKPIPFKQGVMQGAPLSPMLFNLSIDHIFDELSEPSVAEEFGYDLVSDLNNVVTLGFADDIALVAKSTIAASEIFTMTKRSLQQIGLSLNESKTQTIVIEKGKLSSTTLNLGGSIVNSIDGDERIKYLGINFSDEIKFDIAKVINNLNNKIQALTSTYLLKPEQKLNVLNMYIWPILVYPLQNAPLHQLSDRFLEDVDKLIKSSVKEILCLPGDTPDAMLYTERKYKGLSLFKAQWEAYLQHLNICNTLLRTSNPLVVSTRNIAAEKKVCSRKLKIPPEDLDISNINVHKLRQNLRKQEYDKWCALPHKGKGVILFQEYTPGNKWIFSKEGLSSSEWRDAIKMNANVAPVRSLHGRSLDGFRCRYCNEIETLAHVLGSCQHGELLRNSRHHNIRKLIAQALRNKSFEVHEEVHCVASESGGIRRADIVALDKTNSKGFILDPTVRFEMSQTQPSEVNKEKQQIYEPTIPYFREKYQMEGTWEVHGLMIGARGTIPRSTVNTIKTFGIHDIIPKIITSTIKGSIFKQEEFSPCRKILLCVQVCIRVGDMSEAVHILKDNNLISPNPNGWKVRSTKEDMKMQLELCGTLFCRITQESPALMALEFFILLLHTQGSLCNGVDLLQHSNLLMVKLLDEGYQTEALDLYSHIKDQSRGLESPTYRALLVTLVSRNDIILAKHLYQTAQCMHVYSYPWKQLKKFSAKFVIECYKTAVMYMRLTRLWTSQLDGCTTYIQAQELKRMPSEKALQENGCVISTHNTPYKSSCPSTEDDVMHQVKERPYHIKIYSYLMEEEIYIIFDDFLHQLAKELMIDLSGNPQVDSYRASIWIEILEYPSSNLMNILPNMLTRVDKSMVAVQNRIYTVLELFSPLRPIFGQIGHSNSIWLEPESLIICLQRILHSSHPTFTTETQ
ncbi:hypothetical protein ANN_20976 [Periplaneta americana]|uniref:Reverse transcriptase domain-containing protein n=1 Tax=Periplaneta americana TaxID=6978 RepID=A0ABQ8SE35_PERAM|nr:hypothetical protein ANN_20976 [Periplaneta americana]